MFLTSHPPPPPPPYLTSPNHVQASDEQVLSVFPTAIRRRILRHLYMRYLRGCYLFEGAPQRLLDALLATARVETFMPNVDIVSAGDYVNELFLLVAGTVEIRTRVVTPPNTTTNTTTNSISGRNGSGNGSSSSSGSSSGSGTDGAFDSGEWGAKYEAAASMEVFGSRSSSSLRRTAAAGELLGEAAFFTEVGVIRRGIFWGFVGLRSMECF